MAMEVSSRKKRKKNGESPEFEFRRALETCARDGDLRGALSLYRAATNPSEGPRLSAYLVNTFLHLCASSLETLPEPDRSSTIDLAFEMFGRMASPTEATITSLSRIALRRPDGGGADIAFDLVRTMRERYGAAPRLRTYSPVLISFCRKPDAARAYEVERHMIAVGIAPEEPEIAVLLEASAMEAREGNVYEYLHKLRRSVRCVAESTAEILERWFGSEKAAGTGVPDWDSGDVREAMTRNGGGWHGTGWLGSGEWGVRRASIEEEGRCLCCREVLACVDINDSETEKFANSVAALVREREAVSNFSNFQVWLEKHSNYTAIVDGANVGLFQQNFADGGFSMSQLESIVNLLFESGEGKWPLVILHNKRAKALSENASNRELLEGWRAKGVLYTTPFGSNDDWYWLYAAVKLKCLLVTNDEMRDHIFELLGSDFFPKWKERHQAHYSFSRGTPSLQMPPTYSVAIQESETGSWHIPIEGKCDTGSERTWLCVTRAARPKAAEEIQAKL